MQFRRGPEHIAKANESAKASGEYRPFLSSFFWKDGQSRYMLILNPLEDIPMVLMQKVWTADERSELVVARTDEAVGEKKDPLEEEWGYPPQDLNICVAAELEPTIEVVRGRQRPTGFEVKTRTYERRIRDDQGELTDEREEITTPIVGLIAQSPNNFFNHIQSKDSKVGPIHELPACITRVGDDKSTDYEVDLFDDKPLDVSNLIEYLDGISYLGDGIEALYEEIAELEPFEASAKIGLTLLNQRLNEMGGQEYYDGVFEKVEEPARFPRKGWKKDKTEAPERPRRASQRRDKAEETATAEETAPPVEEERPARRATQRRGKAEEVDKASPARDRIEALKARAAARAAAKTDAKAA